MEKRRIGTVTLGICLLLFGCLFLLHLVLPAINYVLIFHLWPVIFILLGIEIIVCSVKSPSERFKYDIGAFFIIIILVLFAMGMAGFDYAITHYPDHWISGV